MIKAFFYDTLCGMVYRCMYAGLDEYGHAQWVNITPGDESKTLTDEVIDEDLGNTKFVLMGLEGETVQPEIIAKVLGKVMESPVAELETDLAVAIRRMRLLGVKWERSPLELEFRVFENKRNSLRKGKYSFWVEDKKEIFCVLTDIDNYSDLKELFFWIRSYLIILEVTAKIPVITKDLRISDDLRDKVCLNDLKMFTQIKPEYDCLANKNKEEEEDE